MQNALPVYTEERELLYYAPIDSVPRLIQAGRVRALGNSRRGVRELVAIRGTDAADLRPPRLPVGQRFSSNHETPDNPRGVWHFHQRSFSYAT